MNKHTALRLLKDLNMGLEDEELDETSFLITLKNYVEVTE